MKGEECGREMELKADPDADSVKESSCMSLRVQHFDGILKAYFVFYLLFLSLSLTVFHFLKTWEFSLIYRLVAEN